MRKTFLVLVVFLFFVYVPGFYLAGHFDRSFNGGAYIHDVQVCQRLLVYRGEDYPKELFQHRESLVYLECPDKNVSAYNYSDKYVYGQMREYSHWIKGDCHFTSVEYFLLDIGARKLTMYGNSSDFFKQIRAFSLDPELKWPYWYWDETKKKDIRNYNSE